jgi:tRNA G18 (ribose-2'-O)-methylase SpoU
VSEVEIERMSKDELRQMLTDAITAGIVAGLNPPEPPKTETQKKKDFIVQIVMALLIVAQVAFGVFVFWGVK